MNDLINLMASAKPLPPDPDDDLMFKAPLKRVSTPRMSATVPAMRGAGEVPPLPPNRTPSGTQQGPTIGATGSSVRVMSAPARATTIPPISSRGSHTQLPADASGSGPVATAFESAKQRTTADVTWVGSPPRRPSKSSASKLVLPLIGASIVAGVLIGGYIAMNSDPATTRTSSVVSEPVPQLSANGPAEAAPAAVVPAAAAEPAPTAPVAAPEAPPVAARAALVDVRIDSRPAGATVMIVDRGKTSFLGTTPISTAVDPSRQYDLVFTYASKPTQLEHLDPAATQHLEVTLGKPGAKSIAVQRPEPVVVEQPAPVAQAIVKVSKPAPMPASIEAALEPPNKARKSRRSAKATSFDDVIEKIEKADAAPEATKPAPTDKPVAAGKEGVLMVSSKPPCEILIDGKPTGLSTPQRELPLATGKHKVTLVNADAGIKKTLSIVISADEPTKVIQDFTK
ncbi:MAG: hypothetical protein WKG01_15725 [Kofleriaceae bacterium]